MAMKKMKCVLLFVALLFCIEAVNGQENGVVRLNFNGNVDPSNTEGVIEVYYNNEWGSICTTSDYPFLYIDVPDVVCHQLGYTGGDFGSNSDVVNTSPVFGLVLCSSSYLTLMQCYCSTSIDPNCTFADNLDITCYTTRIWDNPYTGMVRLQGGYYTGQGIVQVYCNNGWAAVCTDGSVYDYAINMAGTVCTQLGYNDYNFYELDVMNYTGKAWLNNVDCSNSDFRCLSKCSGGKCPSSTFSCSNALNVTCSRAIAFNSGGVRYDCKFAQQHGSGVGAIVGGIVCGFLLGCIILIIPAAVCICCCKRCSSRAPVGRKSTERDNILNRRNNATNYSKVTTTNC